MPGSFKDKQETACQYAWNMKDPPKRLQVWLATKTVESTPDFQDEPDVAKSVIMIGSFDGIYYHDPTALLNLCATTLSWAIDTISNSTSVHHGWYASSLISTDCFAHCSCCDCSRCIRLFSLRRCLSLSTPALMICLSLICDSWLYTTAPTAAKVVNPMAMAGPPLGHQAAVLVGMVVTWYNESQFCNGSNLGTFVSVDLLKKIVVFHSGVVCCEDEVPPVSCYYYY
jgi:hypothetical protein